MRRRFAIATVLTVVLAFGAARAIDSPSFTRVLVDGAMWAVSSPKPRVPANIQEAQHKIVETMFAAVTVVMVAGVTDFVVPR